MKFDAKLKPELLHCKDYTAVELVIGPDGKACMVSTDNHALVRLPVQVDHRDVPGPVSSEALEMARRLARSQRLAEACIECRAETLVLSDGTTLPRPACEKRIPLNDIWPRYDTAAARLALGEAVQQRGGPYVVRLGLSPELLARVARAANEGPAIYLDLVVEAGDDGRAVVREPIQVRGPDGPVALVMPAR